jgi:hypothetical protein
MGRLVIRSRVLECAGMDGFFLRMEDRWQETLRNRCRSTGNIVKNVSISCSVLIIWRLNELGYSTRRLTQGLGGTAKK